LFIIGDIISQMTYRSRLPESLSC